MEAFSIVCISSMAQLASLPLTHNRKSLLRPCICLSNLSSRNVETQPPSSAVREMLPSPSTNILAIEKTNGLHLLNKLFNRLDDMISKFTPLTPSNDPSFVLSGNFAPVDELPPTGCEVIEGNLPQCLNGAYIRNGPNPQFTPSGAPYHLFDGDGMLHCLTISEGRAVLCSRYVRTYKYMKEQEAGTTVLPKIFSGFFGGLFPFLARMVLISMKVLMRLYDPSQGFGTANTNLALLGGRLYALCESDLPYEVQLTVGGDIETVGRKDFDGELSFNMTAHPKVDPETGEAFAFRYQIVPPSLTYFRLNTNGLKEPDVPIKSASSSFSFLHDFAITRKYAIFPDIQMVSNPLKLILDKESSSPFSFDPSKVPRVGVIPRYSIDDLKMRWFEVPGFNPLHVTNAWDDEQTGQVVLLATNCLSLESVLDKVDLTCTSLEKATIDLKTGVVSRLPITCIKNLEFGVINPAYAGKKNRYVYAATCDAAPKAIGVVKIDLLKMDNGDPNHQKECVVATRMYEDGCFGGEPYFIGRQADADAEEDDGYVVTFMHNEITGEPRFIVMDAKSPTLEIVASVRLPQRIPYGFHGTFLRHKDICEKFQE